MEKKLALVTGASSGIGRETARQLSAMGYDLILAARGIEQLKKLSAELGGAEIYPCDLSFRNQAMALGAYIEERKPDIVVNNAGFGVFGDADRAPLSRQLGMIDVNVGALQILTVHALRMMKARGSGRILNVASSAGLFPAGPHMAGYYASKAYVASYTSAVAQELRESGSAVTVSALCPGPVDTNFNRVAGVKFALKGISAADCAAAGIRGMMKGKTIIVPEFTLRAAVFAVRLLPRRLAVWLVGRQQSRKG